MKRIMPLWVACALSILCSGMLFANTQSAELNNAKIDAKIYESLNVADTAAMKNDAEGPSNAETPAVRVVVQLQDQNNVNFGSERSADARGIVANEVLRVQNEFMDLLRSRGMLAGERGVSVGDSFQPVLMLDYQYAVAGMVPNAEVLQKLAGLDEVVRVELDNLNVLFTNEGRNVTGSSLAASSGHRGQNIGVAVIDSHFDLLHPELGGSTSIPNSVVKHAQNFSDPGTSAHSRNFNDCYHGTGTASIVRRYAPDSDIYALTVFPNAFDSVIANAINWCITNKDGSGGGAPIKVISMSLGGGRHFNVCNSGALHTASGNALANGILVFAASGNDGWTNSTGSPACSDNVISVGSTWDANNANYSPFPPARCSDSNRQLDERTCYSDTASFLDIYAPSEEVICARCGGGTFALGGTSSACPAAAGMTAQLLSAAPSLAGNKSSVVTLYQNTGATVIGDSGKRRINLTAAIADATGGTTNPPTATFSASPATINAGGSSTLSWTTTDATSVSINNGVGSVSPASSGSVNVSPSATTTYTLTATGAGGTVTRTATVTVNTSTGSSTIGNGETKNINLATGANAEFTVDLPAGATDFTVTITGNGDLDLYVKSTPINWPGDRGSHNTNTFKAPYRTGSAESVTFASPSSGTWYVLVNGYSAGSGTVTASWTEPSSGGGQWNYVDYVRETPHNYANSQVYEFTYERAGAQRVAVHFATLNTEANYDFLEVYDENDNLVFRVSGNLISNGSGNAFNRTDGWVIVNGTKARVRLVTDFSVTRYGFRTDQAAYFQ